MRLLSSSIRILEFPFQDQLIIIQSKPAQFSSLQVKQLDVNKS